MIGSDLLVKLGSERFMRLYLPKSAQGKVKHDESSSLFVWGRGASLVLLLTSTPKDCAGASRWVPPRPVQSR